MDEGPIATNYSREEINLLVDTIPSLTIRGGYRYEWGNVLAPLAFIGRTTPLSGPFETTGLNRNTALAGVSYRWQLEAHDQRGCRGCPRQSHLLSDQPLQLFLCAVSGSLPSAARLTFYGVDEQPF